MLAGRQTSAETLQNALLLLIGLSLALAAGLSFALGRSTRHFMQSLQARAKHLEGEMERRRETEATLQQAQKMEAVGQLTGGIAHDFNNLLTVIMGNLDTLKRRLKRKERSLPKLRRAGCCENDRDRHSKPPATRAKLTHRLLAFARRQPLEPVRTDCNRLVSEMSEMLRRTLGETVQFETVSGVDFGRPSRIPASSKAPYSIWP